MTFLYACRHDGDQYRISKLTDNLDVEASYLCTFEDCECPAGVRPTCRHRQMLPKFIERGAVSTGWMLDFDRGGWVDNRTEDELNELPKLSGLQEEQILMGFHNLPEGVEAFSLDNPATLHNAIADAVGEPEAKLELSQVPASADVPPRTFRRF